jgi:hypothetical protein
MEILLRQCDLSDELHPLRPAATEHAGVAAAVDLITQLDTEHEVHVIPIETRSASTDSPMH